jgi:hypothetical protein
MFPSVPELSLQLESHSFSCQRAGCVILVARRVTPEPGRTVLVAGLAHFCPNSEKLVPSIPARNFNGIDLPKSYAKWESGTKPVMYDLFRIAEMMLFTGLKYLEYISSSTIMHNDTNNQT